MELYTLFYDVRDIYDSYFVQKQIPALSRMPELKELHNDRKSKTQDILRKLTGLSPEMCAWESCIFYMEDKTLLGYLLSVRTGTDTVLLRDIYISDDAPRKDCFLLMIARAVRNTLLGENPCNRLDIQLFSPDLYDICVEYLGEGCELIY